MGRPEAQDSASGAVATLVDNQAIQHPTRSSAARWGVVGVWALIALIVGLALHNLAMALLYRAGVRGNALSAIAAWKDVMLVGLAAWGALYLRRERPLIWVDRLALLYAAMVIIYGLLPQRTLGGHATEQGVLYAGRHDLLPVIAYFFGRSLTLDARSRRSLELAIVMTAVGLGVLGLFDVYLVPLSLWEPTAGWFRNQLGLNYGPLVSHLPENFVYNSGDNIFFRRLTSVLLSPLAAAYVLMVSALVLWGSKMRLAMVVPVSAVLIVSLAFTHTRAAFLGLVVGVVVVGAARRKVVRAFWFAGLLLLSGVLFFNTYPDFGPRANLDRAAIQAQERHAAVAGAATASATHVQEASISEHIQSIRADVSAIMRRPLGYGLGNVGSVAKRTNVPIVAGESTFLEVAGEIGVLGLAVFLVWSALLIYRIRLYPGAVAALIATLFVGGQTDVVGVPWIAVVVWTLAGTAVASSYSQGEEHDHA